MRRVCKESWRLRLAAHRGAPPTSPLPSPLLIPPSGKVVFVTVDLDGTTKDPVVNFFGIKEDAAPVLVGFDMGANKKFRHTAELT